MPNFWGAHPEGYEPHIQTRPRFLYTAPTPKFCHPMFTRLQVIVLTNKHTNRCCWKHPMFFVAERHIFGGAHPGGYDPHIWTRSRFLYSAPTPKFRHPMFTRSEVIVLTNTQTNRCHWKHPTFFATLRRRVIIQNAVRSLLSVCTYSFRGPGSH